MVRLARTRVKTDKPLAAEEQGDRQEFERIQSEGAVGNAPSPNGTAAPAASPLPRGGVFGPTDRPLEAPTAGVGVGPGPGATPTLPDDPRLVARQIYEARPTSHTFRLAFGDQ